MDTLGVGMVRSVFIWNSSKKARQLYYGKFTFDLCRSRSRCARRATPLLSYCNKRDAWGDRPRRAVCRVTKSILRAGLILVEWFRARFHIEALMTAMDA